MNKTCSKCGVSKPLDEFYKRNNSKDGRRLDCKKCRNKYLKNYRQEHQEGLLVYQKKYYQENKEKISKQMKNHYQEHKEEISKRRKNHYQEHKEEISKRKKNHYENGGREQRKKYYKNGGREKQGFTSMYENKLCAQYLGVVIGERLCCHLFKDVEIMPYGNPGFDIICNKGKNIDVKSSCTHFKKSPYWIFHIRNNTIADYFVCVAFDNVNEINPLHLWMIPGNEVNERKSISISSTTIHKWDKWKRDINDAQLCCTEMKEVQK